MLPLSVIPTALPAQNIAMRPEVLPPEAPGTSGPSTVSPSAPASESFGNLLGKMVEEVNSRQVAASNAMQTLQSGGNVTLPQAMIAMEEANVSFQLMVEVRNRLLDSYQEVMKMQV